MPSVSKKQHNFMNAIAHNKAFAKKVGVPQSVGKDFSEADKGKKFKQGGIMAKKEMHSEKSEMKMDTAQDKAMIKKAFRQHDMQEHKGGKGTKLALKKGGSAAMCYGGKVKKMAIGGATGSFNSTGNNPYTPPMQTGAIGGLDQLNQSIGTIQNALGGAPKNVGESTQMYKRGGKVKKMAMGGAPVDPRAAAMAAKKAAMAAPAMPMGAKRGMPMARPQAPQMASMPQGKPMVGRMPPQANMPTPTYKKGGVAKTVTKEMEYDYKTGKKSFAGTTAQRDAHAEKEGKRVAKDYAYDMSKGMKKGGMTKMGAVKTKPGNINGVAKTGLTKGKMVKMARGGGIEVRGKTKGTMVKMKGC
jgi:hypothetical protein